MTTATSRSDGLAERLDVEDGAERRDRLAPDHARVDVLPVANDFFRLYRLDP